MWTSVVADPVIHR